MARLKIALVHDHFDADHLEQVREEMQVLGAPTVKAVWMECWGTWCALEGCHRLRAAHELGLVPEVESVEYAEGVTTESLGLDYEDETTVSEIVDGAYARTTLVFGA